MGVGVDQISERLSSGYFWELVGWDGKEVYFSLHIAAALKVAVRFRGNQETAMIFMGKRRCF